MMKFLNFLFSLVFTFRKKDTQTVAIVRIDNIGDYILFRNFLPFIRQSSRYVSKRLILVGNKAWKDLAESLDASYVDAFFWIDPSLYAKNKWYRFKTLYRLNQLNATELVNTVHSRTWITNEIIYFSKAINKITCEGDDVNLTPQSKKENDALFDIIIPSLPTSFFEFERNRFFIEQLLNEKIDVKCPFFLTPKPIVKIHCISLFIGAHNPLRIWSVKHFSQLIILIHKNFPNYYFQILGSQHDFENGQKIISNLENNNYSSLVINNLCGKTSLIDLINYIAESALLVSNETSGVHIAAAVDTETICISNGNHFGRFCPYHLSMTDKIITIFPNDSFYESKNKEIYAEQFKYQSNIDINQIAPIYVFLKIASILNNNNR